MRARCSRICWPTRRNSARPRHDGVVHAAGSRGGRMKILLVDDDRDHVDLLAFSLRRAGLTPVPAYDRPTALGLFETQEPDLVVLDINLGVWDGLDLLKEVRRRSQVPVLMLTARDTED